MSKLINFEELEKKWIKLWRENGIFEADPNDKSKIFVTFPFPYMNGPLHLGHAFTALRVDVYARLKRMQGFNVLFPWAWHWTGATIAGQAKRIAEHDEHVIRVLVEIDGVNPREVEKFIDPIYMAKYYTNENKFVVDGLGFSVDWRREFHTTSHHKAFSKFIEWQYLKLREKGYIVKGTHPIVWCPRCKSPTGDHDRLEGVGVSPEKYILMKFKCGDLILPAATFRPETIYGVTNLWLNPNVDYLIVHVDGEKWILSKPAAEKISNQLKKVEYIGELKGRELIGKKCIAPVVGREVIILPAFFVDPNNGTGVVYSVPAHAPYDWIALKDLLDHPELLSSYEISRDEIERIKPISLIEVEGFGEFPAIEIVEKLKVRDQHDPKVEEATQIIYKREFHKGVLKSIYGKYAGLKVFEAKDKIIEEFLSKGCADIMYDLTQKVICRCGTPCIVKVLKDQWFLKYSDKEWKQLAKSALKNMKIYPEDARKNFEEVIDWLQDKACTRATGLGTPLPWDEKWLVETLSDSTIYMAFYTISKYVNDGRISPEKLTPELLDYIFLGRGDSKSISKSHGLPLNLINEMRSEFDYWYPVDLRVSAKELLPNHLTFFIFHHVAIFPPEKWPKAIGVNGMLMIEGKPMSKSKGIFITLKNAIKMFGADVIRGTLLLSAEDLDDPDWRNKNAEDFRRNLKSIFNFMLELKKRAMSEKISELREIDRWLISQINKKIKTITKNAEQLKTRTAFHEAFYGIWNDVKWYLRRVEKVNGDLIADILNIWVKLLAPFIPFTAEELWEKLGNKPFVSTASWPNYDEKKIDLRSDFSEKLIKNLLEDILKIRKAIKINPSRIYLYVAPAWKYDVYIEVAKLVSQKASLKEIVRHVISKFRAKYSRRELIKLVQYSFEDIVNSPHVERKLKIESVSRELEIYESAKDFLERELKIKVSVYRADQPEIYDPKRKANSAMPFRPGIYIE